MEEWTTVNRVYETEEKAQKAANIIGVTESRLSSSAKGAQYSVETEIIPVEQGWQVRWRKILIGYGGGCSGCGSCTDNSLPQKEGGPQGKILPFRPKVK